DQKKLVISMLEWHTHVLAILKVIDSSKDLDISIRLQQFYLLDELLKKISVAYQRKNAHLITILNQATKT
ncbi:3233_t:CDS:1, partial [Ambispora leptoticha]